VTGTREQLERVRNQFLDGIRQGLTGIYTQLTTGTTRVSAVDTEGDQLLNSVISTLGETWSATAQVLRVQAAMSFPLLVARGLVPGISVVHKFGKLPNVSTADGAIAVWAGTKGPYLGFGATDGEAITAVSSSASDTGTVLSSGTATSGTSTTLIDTGATFVSGGGAVGDLILNDTQADYGIVTAIAETTITVFRFNSGTIVAASDSYRLVTAGAATGATVLLLKKILAEDRTELTDEFVVLNGTTGVDTTVALTAVRCTRGRIIHAGSSGSNVGDVTATQKTTTANIYMKLLATYNSTMILCDTVPAGKTGYLLQWGGGVLGSNNGDIEIRLLSRPIGGVFQVQEESSVRATGTSTFNRAYQIPKNGHGGGTDIYVDCNADANNMSFSGHFTLLLLDD